MKKTASSHPERQRLKLKLLHPHPLQATYYSQTSKDEDDRLVQDIREHGQRDDIIVVPMKGKPGHYLILEVTVVSSQSPRLLAVTKSRPSSATGISPVLTRTESSLSFCSTTPIVVTFI